MGIILAAILGLYLLVSLGVVIGAVVYARREGRSAKRWGWSAALVMYLIPFWDWIPTVAMHRYYCETEAGFWVYKTPEQWKKENPGVMETLVANKAIIPSRIEGDDNNWTHVFELNQRINKVTKHRGPLLLHRWVYESMVIDSRTSEVLARTVDSYTAQTRAGGGWRGWKFWLAIDHCHSNRNDANLYGSYLDKIKGAKK